MSNPRPSWATRWALGGVAFYRRFLSRPLHALPGTGCRYHPTCSCYMATSLERFGFRKGLWLGLKRLGRCHPWGGSGLDDVPEK